MQNIFRKAVKKSDGHKSWREYETKADRATNFNPNFSKYGTINDDTESDRRDSGYEYGLMLEENFNPQSQDLNSPSNANTIKHKNGVRGSRTNFMTNASYGFNSKSNKNIKETSTRPEYFTSRKNYKYRGTNDSGVSLKKNEADSSLIDKSTKLHPDIKQLRPQSSLNSHISSNQNSAIHIDRSTWAQKSKPTRQRPVIEIRDDASEIYDGEGSSFKDSEFNSHDEEQVELNCQSAASSFHPDHHNTHPEDESNGELILHQVRSKYADFYNSTSPKRKSSRFGSPRNNFSSIPNSCQNIHSQFKVGKKNSKKEYQKFIQAAKRNKSQWASTSLEKQDTSATPEMGYLTHDRNDTSPKNMNNVDSRVYEFKGDLDSFSRIPYSKVSLGVLMI